MYKTVLMLSIKCLISHRGDAHKTEFSRVAVVAFKWAREPLSRVASRQLSHQQLYGELESAFQLRKEAKLEMLRVRATIPTDYRFVLSNYVGQPRYRRDKSKNSCSRNEKCRSTLDIQGFFNSDSSDHLQSTAQSLLIVLASRRESWNI